MVGLPKSILGTLPFLHFHVSATGRISKECVLHMHKLQD